MASHLTILTATSRTYDIKKSRFIAHLVPLAAFPSALKQLRDEHKKARHFVWATRHLHDQQIEENCTDDGEPRNTSGKPTLNALQNRDLIDIGLVTVRYFGGIKLGTGGLVRAYSEAANRVIETARLIAVDNLYRQTIQLSYPQFRHFEYLIGQTDLHIIDKTFQSCQIDVTLQGPKTAIDRLCTKLNPP